MLTVPVAARASFLDGFETFMATGSGTAKLRLMQHLVTLVEFSLSNTPFGSASQDSIVLASTPIAGTAVASGRATRFELVNRNAVVALSGDVGGTDSYAFRVPRALITSAAAQRLASVVLRMGPNGQVYLEASAALQ